VEGVEDSGAKFVSALAAMLDARDEGEIARLVDQIADLVGYLYRFSLPVSAIRR
jgi:hypothetical protein